MAGKVDGFGLGTIAVGSVVMYAGIKGYSIPDAFRAIITGQSPTTLPQSRPINTPTTASGTTSTVAAGGNSGSVVAAAQAGVGHCYLYGGAPGTNGKSCWDCSSFANWCVGKVAGLSIPGFPNGTYTGAVHGPATTEWGTWGGLTHIGRADVQAGDIVVWTGHMGIAISNKDMISAHDPAQGTSPGPIDGGGDGPLMCYGRLKSTTVGTQ